MSAFSRGIGRAIRSSLGRFLAIMGIVALGCGFFAGMHMGGPGMRAAADAYYDDAALWYLRVVSTQGLGEMDVERLARVAGVSGAVGSTSVDVMERMGSEQVAARVSSLPEEYEGGSSEPEVNRLVLRDGRWPSEAGECVASADNPALPVEPGDVVEVLREAGDAGALVTDELTVVGTVSSSMYPYTVTFGSTTLGSGVIDQYLYVPASAFSEDAPYTEAYLCVAGAEDEESGSAAYEAAVGEVAYRIEGDAPALAEARLADVRADAQERVDEARAGYEDERASAEAELADGRAELDEALSLIDVAQAEVDALEPGDIYVLDRTQNEGTASYQADSERIDKIATVFPLMFFLVAALVSLTTMTRMVEDERGVIGTLKALGYGMARIASRYLAYAGLAATAGAVIGILVLSQVFPLVVMSAYQIIYAVPLPSPPLAVDPAVALSSAGLGVGVTLAATWAAVVASLRESPAALMLPRAPKPGRRILLERIRPLWRRLSFLRKVTARNLFRYKRRLLMTVVGISGCTALLLVGFGLHDAIWDIIDNQFGPIVRYDTAVSLDDGATAEETDAVAARLVADGRATDLAHAATVNLQLSSPLAEGAVSAQVIVPEDVPSFEAAIDLHDRLSGEGVPLEGEGVVLAEKTAAKLGVSVGDEVVLRGQDAVGNAVGEGCALTVSGVVENYVGDLAYLASEAWGTLRSAGVVDDGEPSFSTIYASIDDDPSYRAGLADELAEAGPVSTVAFVDETVGMYRDMLSAVDMIVVVLIVSAVALAFIVLYNLANINVDERIREIATLKVLGFRRGEVAVYVFREILVLALLGDVLGLVLGTWLEGFVIVTAEVDLVMFGRVIHLASYTCAFVLTLVFAGLVMLAMRRKLDGVDMVESLKSVD